MINQSKQAAEKNLPQWIVALRRDLLEPYRQLAIRQDFFLKLEQGTLPDELFERYLLDTQWAVMDFSRIAKDLANRSPSGYQSQMNVIAKEEQWHPQMLSHVIQAFELDAPGIIAGDENYRPTPLYELWWQFIRHCARDLPWEESIAAVLVGIEDLARVQEEIVGKALVQNYGL